jgi:HK97 family phage portal protein
MGIKGPVLGGRELVYTGSVLRKTLFDETRKSLGNPDGVATPSFSLTGNLGARRLNGASQRRHMQTYGGEDAIDWVMDCVDLYAQTGSNASYYFHETLDPGANSGTVKPEPSESPPQDLVNLFAQPNPYMDYTELLELAIIDLLVAGEFFWLKFRPGIDPASPQYGKPLSLYRLSPALVEIVMDDNDKPDYVEWRAPGGGGDAVRIKPEHVIHVKRPNPHNQWRGLSVIASSPHAMDVELAVTEAMKNYYDNGAAPSGVLESDRTVPASTWKKIKRQFRRAYQGRQAAGEVLMLERGVKWNPMGGNASDAAYAEISTLSEKRIAKAFKVPLPLLGEVGGTDRQSIREAQRIFDNKIMRPFLNRIQKQVSLQLTQAWGLDWYIDYEYVMPIEDKLDLADGAAALPGILTREVRGLVDLAPLEELGIKDGKKIDEMVLNLPAENVDQGGFADRRLPQEGGRPAKGANTKNFPQGDQPMPAGAQALPTQKSLDAIESSRELRRIIRKARERLKAVN